MARPKKDVVREPFTLRLSEDERVILERMAKSEGKTLGRFIRDKALRKRAIKEQPNSYPPVTADPSEVRQIFKELRRIGNNLNQIARSLNVGNMEFISSQDMDELRSLISSIKTTFKL